MSRRSLSVIVALSLGMLIASPSAGVAAENGLWDIVATLQSKTFVDLTHAFDRNIPHWKGFDPAKRVTTYYYDEGVGVSGYGFLVHEYTHVGQWGTHVSSKASGSWTR